jgi:hypothetical protein
MIAHFVGSDTGAFIVAVSWFGAAYCLGGLHGLLLAWSQPARMAHWAKRVEWAQRKINELEDRADGVPTDRDLPVGSRLADFQGAPTGETRRAERSSADVPTGSEVAVVDPGEGSPAVITGAFRHLLPTLGAVTVGSLVAGWLSGRLTYLARWGA